jgi:uncharacterized MAPEG superfamily protein
MEYVAIIIALALIEYMIFGGYVGWARAKFGIKAPAISGHDVFERYFRVHMNTLENLIIFIPAIVLFATYVHELIAAGLGLIFIIGRVVYFRGYIKEPKARHLGSMISSIPMIILLLGGLFGAVFTFF